VNKRYEKISLTSQILSIYMFSGLSMGLAANLKHQITMVVSFLIYFGGLSTIQMLHSYCKKNELKIFRRISLNLFGFIIWFISFAILMVPN